MIKKTIIFITIKFIVSIILLHSSIRQLITQKNYNISLLELYIRLVRTSVTQRITRVVYWNSYVHHSDDYGHSLLRMKVSAA